MTDEWTAYTALQNVPFKAAMDDTHYLDEDANIFYVQASYDLRPEGELLISMEI